MAEVVTGPYVVEDANTLDAIARMRFEVWNAKGLIVPEAFPGATWRDPLDAIATHLAVDVDGRLSAAIRYAQFARLDQLPEAPHLRTVGVALEGAIGLPERLFVRPGLRHLRLPERLADAVLDLAIARGARWIITEATPPMVAMLKARGRKHLGPAAHDPRFPTVEFQLMLTDVASASRSR